MTAQSLELFSGSNIRAYTFFFWIWWSKIFFDEVEQQRIQETLSKDINSNVHDFWETVMALSLVVFFKTCFVGTAISSMVFFVHNAFFAQAPLCKLC